MVSSTSVYLHVGCAFGELRTLCEPALESRPATCSREVTRPRLSQPKIKRLCRDIACGLWS